MKLKEHQFKIQTENPVDFKSLTFNGCEIKEFYAVQGLLNYFNLLNGPIYKALIRHFWVRASMYDREVSELEEQEKILIDPTLARNPSHVQRSDQASWVYLCISQKR